MAKYNVTLNDLVTAQAPLQRLVQHEMAARVAFHLARIVRQLNPELQDYNITRRALFQQLGIPSEDKTQFHVEPENQAKFMQEMQALLDTEVELDIIQIAEDDLPNLTAADAMALWWLVEEPTEESKE